MKLLELYLFSQIKFQLYLQRRYLDKIFFDANTNSQNVGYFSEKKIISCPNITQKSVLWQSAIFIWEFISMSNI
jgi:hypothetical protein